MQPLFRMAKNGVNNVALGLNSTRRNYSNTSIHAEVDATNKLPFKKIYGKVDLFVIRMSKTGKLSESRPCLACLNYMRRMRINIKHVYYSSKTGDIIRENFNDMKSGYISYGRRKFTHK